MKLPKIPLAQTVIKLCELKGIKHIVISPGSRNAPLIIGFTNHPFFKCYSIVDERCAGFFALGIAQQTQEPVALVCTSGSALLNYFPAVAEAHYSNIPLVVLSADRPEYLVGIGDGQTIDQKNVYGNHCICHANLKEDIYPEKLSKPNEPKILKNLENKLEKFLGIQESIQNQNVALINQALNTAALKKGPVHINIPFSEPLYEAIEEFTVSPEHIAVKKVINELDELTLKMLSEQWNAASKKMILIGVNYPDQIEPHWFDELAKDTSIIVFTETTSNVHHESFFSSIDKIIAPLDESEFEELQPEILLTFGGMIVSKKIKAFLRKYKPDQHWHVGENAANDTFFCLNKHLNTNINLFLSQFCPLLKAPQSNYHGHWNSVKLKRNQKHEAYLKTIDHSDLKVYDKVLRSIPDNCLFQVGNSTAIRYLQLFDLNPTLKVFCNRGTSGIDGSTSTAIGAAVTTNEQTLFITGDLSFFYDSNALWNNYIPNNFRIILINNGGGGIFRILPGHKQTKNFDTFLETKHHLNAQHLCDMFQISYQKATDKDQLDIALSNFYSESEKPKLLEIVTPSELSATVLLNYFNYIK
ncbi:MAG: 2-succinyl-5-enolpyruvyl-6-hydroxy-3-cyclohexene-1-carboxylic-acid synthase [Bacteroidia bacterium]|nr:2-succinyl-5-enolpyruvyl-6-hydroxy-3-cyclohexene-1-carboxylic-acid synthase [Bacteroidia bacterium]NND25937.1 2-succinyl-5-enolpyruvyl-6-hydroxy-3-cyclohexene-1-carboxylic-acid synthase [Flavobacteriaceae bacterium]NNK60776.1 2-succinyl-5-enolpyruvyl-6-hydroxy-3-cyclohexene-1-carboxylic-acid synthase [Flavobacteriaceae bacterium]